MTDKNYNSASSAGAAAEMAASRKQAKYAALSGSYVVFQPIALKTLGPINESAVQFLNDFDHKITSVSDKEGQFLFQQLSIARQIQCHLAVRVVWK